MKKIVIYFLPFFLLFSCSKERPQSEQMSLWLASLDSIKSRTTNEKVLALCYLGKQLKEVDSSEVEQRKISFYEDKKKNFDLVIYFDKHNSDSTCLAHFMSGINVITIVDAKNEKKFGDNSEYISKASVLFHELAHAYFSISGSSVLLDAEDEHKFTEALGEELVKIFIPEMIDSLPILTGPHRSGNLQDFFLRRKGRIFGDGFNQVALTLFVKEQNRWLAKLKNENDSLDRMLKQVQLDILKLKLSK